MPVQAAALAFRASLSTAYGAIVIGSTPVCLHHARSSPRAMHRTVMPSAEWDRELVSSVWLIFIFRRSLPHGTSSRWPRFFTRVKNVELRRRIVRRIVEIMGRYDHTAAAKRTRSTNPAGIKCQKMCFTSKLRQHFPIALNANEDAHSSHNNAALI